MHPMPHISYNIESQISLWLHPMSASNSYTHYAKWILTEVVEVFKNIFVKVTTVNYAWRKDILKDRTHGNAAPIKEALKNAKAGLRPLSIKEFGKMEWFYCNHTFVILCKVFVFFISIV